MTMKKKRERPGERVGRVVSVQLPPDMLEILERWIRAKPCEEWEKEPTMTDAIKAAVIALRNVQEAQEAA